MANENMELISLISPVGALLLTVSASFISINRTLILPLRTDVMSDTKKVNNNITTEAGCNHLNFRDNYSLSKKSNWMGVYPMVFTRVYADITRESFERHDGKRAT